MNCTKRIRVNLTTSICTIIAPNTARKPYTVNTGMDCRQDPSDRYNKLNHSHLKQTNTFNVLIKRQFEVKLTFKTKWIKILLFGPKETAVTINKKTGLHFSTKALQSSAAICSLASIRSRPIVEVVCGHNLWRLDCFGFNLNSLPHFHNSYFPLGNHMCSSMLLHCRIEYVINH